jgi:hypothetical protein
VKVHKIEIEDFDDTDYGLIALTTTSEDYSLAFSINQKLNVSLKRQKYDHPSFGTNIDNGFSVYEFTDSKNNLSWSLVQNQRWIEVIETGVSLFNETQKKIYLFPEYKNIDFFLKIEGLESDEKLLHEIITQIKQISKVAASFLVDTDAIKSKFNLKF